MPRQGPVDLKGGGRGMKENAFPPSLKDDRNVLKTVESPRLSVIIPVFNAELYLHECLASVLTQGAFDNLEVICIDDGSIDSSKAILLDWADRDARLKVLTQANQGPGVARNAGLAVAKGDYIMFLDADDRLTSGANLKVAFDHAMENRLDVAVMASNSGPCSDGGWRDNRHLRRELIPDKTVFEPEDIGINLYQFAVQEPWAKLYRREFVTANELEFPALKRSEDFPFVMSALLLSRRIGVLEVPLCDHRIGGALSLEATKDETPCIFIDATKWFSKAVQLQDRPKWVKMAAHISKVNRYAYNLKAVGRYSSFRLIVKCLCEEQDDFFLRVVECELPWYLAAYDFLNQIKQSAEDDAALIECFVSVQVKKQLEEQQKAVVVRDGWIRGLNRQVAGLKEACSKRDEWITTLQSQLDQLRKATSERDKWLAAEKAKVARRDEWIRGFDGQIAGLREAVKKRDGRIVGLCEEIACKKTAIEKRDNCISRIEKELDQLDEGEMR